MKVRVFTLIAGFVLISIIPCFSESPARAKVRECSKVDTKWEARADKNKDGRVDKVEAHRWKRRRHQVNTSVEKKHDVNCNGYLEPQEAKEMLKDKCAIINTHGKAKVDSAIEAEYDTNKDGVIDAAEAGCLKEALK
jgi:hypothetical protein